MVWGLEQVDTSAVKKCAKDLRSLLDDFDYTKRKAFLRSFVKRIVVDQEEITAHYELPLPPDGKSKEKISVLPIDTFGGAEGTRTPDPLLAKEVLSHLSYSPRPP